MGSFASVSFARLTPSRHPKTRRLLRVEIADQIVTGRVTNELMGKDPVAETCKERKSLARSKRVGRRREYLRALKDRSSE
jgi:hypothetical protein